MTGIGTAINMSTAHIILRQYPSNNFFSISVIVGKPVLLTYWDRRQLTYDIIYKKKNVFIKDLYFFNL